LVREPARIAVILFASALVVSIVGYNDMRQMLQAWDGLYEAQHPQVRFELDLPGTKAAPEALARGRCVLAPMGAEFTPEQMADYRRIAGADPVGFRVARASLSPKARSGPVVVVVPAQSAFGSLTKAQVKQIFGGQWAGPPLHPIGLGPASVIGQWLIETQWGGAGFNPAYRALAESDEVIAAVAADPLAIGFARANAVTPAVRIVPVGPAPEGPFTKYPYERYLFIYARAPLSPFVRDYLRVVFSAAGQQAVARTPQAYRPLTDAECAEETRRLGTRN
jgi:phosphate transport system substrate-binding protein